MYLKSLELHGFKSFPEKTTLHFHDGATVIVGPNGSGKSNITDAMRWVLGELSTKNIRGSKMEDVVFAGADGKKPMSFAEVSVTFDDSAEPRVLAAGYEEVTVTRRYYRSGDSEYFINRKRARLKDIYELFMNTGIGREGYSMVGQGKIAEIISKKSEERRSAFEESAGISKFRYRKTESEKKLAETAANMERVADIEGELAGRIGPLEKDAAKARKYLELYDAKKRTDVALWLYDADQFTENIRKAERDTRMSEHELEMAEDSRRQTEDRIDRLYEQSHANKEASQHNHESRNAAVAEKARLDSEIEVAKSDIRHKADQIATEQAAMREAEAELTNAKNRETELLLRQAETDGQLGEAAAQSGAAEEAVRSHGEAKARADAQLESMLNEQKTREASLTDLRVRINVLEQTASTQSERQRNIAAEADKYKAEEKSYDKILADSAATAAAYEKSLAEVENARTVMAAEQTNAEKKADELRRRINELSASREGIVSRIGAIRRMQEHFDGYNNSIRFVMNQANAGKLSGIHGPVSYLIRVAEQYVIAIETALGSALQNIITEDENAAKAAIGALKQANAGRATFYPISTIRPIERGREFDGVENGPGFVGYADSLVECDEKYRSIIRSQLARTAVFDTLDHATTVARTKNWRIRVVTLDGQIINAGGSFTGGQAKRESGILTRTSQIDRMEEERKALEGSLAEAGAELKRREQELEKAVSQSKANAENKALLTTLLQAENARRGEAEAKKRYVAGLLANLQRDSEAIEETGKRSAADIETLRSRAEVLTAEIAAIGADREKIAAGRHETEEALTLWQEKWQAARIRLAELGRDGENLTSLLAECIARQQSIRDTAGERQTRIDTLGEEIQQLESAVTDKTAESTVLAKAICELSEKGRVLHDSGDALEQELSGLQTKLREQTGKKELVFAAHSKNETRLESLRADYEKMTQRLWDEYELSYATAKAWRDETDIPPVEQGQRTAHLAKQQALKNEIRALGHVNVDAIEEYTEVKKRYDYVSSQLNDLRSAKEELEKVLSGIEKEMKDIFLAAFGQINTYFGQVFRELFGGGQAEVTLTDPENPLTCGIEISAAPPGKTIKNLNLLSGGEQAFIAIALLFALIKVNPSPFCIFDEIEAALDETNVARVGRYVKKYTDEMQIIMISHRRGTMEIADTLYGVTMPQPGISKVTTVDLRENNENLVKN